MTYGGYFSQSEQTLQKKVEIKRKLKRIHAIGVTAVQNGDFEAVTAGKADDWFSTLGNIQFNSISPGYQGLAVRLRVNAGLNKAINVGFGVAVPFIMNPNYRYGVTYVGRNQLGGIQNATLTVNITFSFSAGADYLVTFNRTFFGTSPIWVGQSYFFELPSDRGTVTTGVLELEINNPNPFVTNFMDLDNFFIYEYDKYESEWQDITTLVGYNPFLDNKEIAVEKKLPNDTTELGYIPTNKIFLELLNPNNKLNNEIYSESIFYGGYSRHGSLIRISQHYTKASTGNDETEYIVFIGCIDGFDSTALAEGIEKLSLISLLEFILANNVLEDSIEWAGYQSLTNTHNDLVIDAFLLYEPNFTYIYASADVTIKQPRIIGLLLTNVDLTQYDGENTTIKDLIQDMMLGHTIYYLEYDTALNQTLLYVSSINTSTTPLYTFGTTPERKIKLDKFNDGIKYVKSRLFWSNSFERYLNGVLEYQKLYTFAKTIALAGITDTTDRQNLLNYIGARVDTARRRVEVDIVFFPEISINTTIAIKNEGYSQYNIPDTLPWLVRGYKHTTNLKTILFLEEILT